MLRTDPRYAEIEQAIYKVRQLLNDPDPPGDEAEPAPSTRLAVLASVEEILRGSVSKLMPSIKGIKLKVLIEETQEVFSRGVELKVDDGVMTDVLVKGNGCQRCIVFALLQTLIQNVKGNLCEIGEGDATPGRPILLGIEEPELYIHPQLQRRVHQVLKEFAEEPDCDDQVLFTTHAPAFIDVADYHRIGVVRKQTTNQGTKVHQCETGILGSVEEIKGFKLLTSFSLDHNRMFLATRTILVEGEQDEIAIIATAREVGLLDEFPEEIDYTIIVTGNKEEIPKFQKLLNGFGLPYVVMLELDGKPEGEGKNAEINGLLNGNKCVRLPQRLEEIVGHAGHFQSTYHAVKWFEDPAHITPEWTEKVRDMFADALIDGQEGPGKTHGDESIALARQ